jgi:hypothetical protein
MFGVITYLSRPDDFVSRSRHCQDIANRWFKFEAKAEGNYIYRLLGAAHFINFKNQY